MTSPDKFPRTASTPDEATTRTSRDRQRVAPRKTAAWLRTGFATRQATPNAPQRIRPRMRLMQLGAALTAAGALGAMVGQPGPAVEQDGVRLATDAAPVQEKSVAFTENATTVAAKERAVSPKQPDAKGSGAKDPDGKDPDGKDKAASPKQQSTVSKDPVDRWITQATSVLKHHGYTESQLDRGAIRTIIMHESGGDPTATNNWDSNAAAGTPSMGLMQTIEPTFESYALPGHDEVLDPVDNIIAATRYAVDRYGALSEVPGVSGMRSGGTYQGY